jgi:hypothetical protein
MSTQTASTSEFDMGRHIAELENEVAMLRRVIGAERYLVEYFERYGYDQKEVTQKLHGCSETNDVWVAVQITLRQLILAEDHSARIPGLSNEDLRWNVARSASLRDLQHSLYELRDRANKLVKAS